MAQLQRVAIAPDQFVNDHITLTTAQQHYLGRVLRLAEGDRFIAMDGQGHWWLVQLAETAAQVLEPISISTELPVTITLAIAMPKGNSMDEVVRQVTELGVSQIVPLISDRTLLKPSPQKLERWRRIAQEAAEQSERQIVPTISEPMPFAAQMQQLAPATLAYLCVARGDVPSLLHQLTRQQLADPAGPLPDRSLAGDHIMLATGPEGGWTPAEIEQAIAAGYQPVSLGRRILRAVTAPVVALSVLSAVYESGSESGSRSGSQAKFNAPQIAKASGREQ